MANHPGRRDRGLPLDVLQLDPAAAARVCALATTTARAAQGWADEYGVATPDIAWPIAMSAAFAAPWRHPDELAVANRIAHWNFWLDDVIETAPSEVAAAELAERCGAVATGDDPAWHDSTTLALADIRDALVDAPLWPALGARWRDAVARTVDSYRQYRVFVRGLAEGRPPPAGDYQERTCGTELCWMSYLIAAEGPELVEHVSPLLEAIESADRAHRLVNDLASVERDRRDGDVNVLMLGVTPEEARAMEATYVDRALSVLAPLVAGQVRAAIEIDRRTRYTIAFYRAMDYRHPAVTPSRRR